MKTRRLILSIALATVTSAAQAEPQSLTDSQMDAVTAGEVLIGVFAVAAAGGDQAYTNTQTSTLIISSPDNVVDIGLGKGQATACCGSDINTAVSTTADASGDKVIQTSLTIDTAGPGYSQSLGFINVIAITPPSSP